MNELKAVVENHEDCVLAAAKRGNAEAFEELYRIHVGRVFHVARRITGNQRDAEDTSRESVVSAFIHLSAFDRKSRFSTWLTNIAIIAALTVLRKKGNSIELPTRAPIDSRNDAGLLEMVDSSLNPEEEYADQEQNEIFTRSVVGLRSQYHEIIEFYPTRQCSILTAELLGILETAVKARLLRARRTLRRTIPASVRLQRRSAMWRGLGLNHRTVPSTLPGKRNIRFQLPQRTK